MDECSTNQFILQSCNSHLQNNDIGLGIYISDIVQVPGFDRCGSLNEKCPS